MYDANAIIKYGNEMTYAEVTQLAGIGKYPHLLVNSNELSNSAGQTKGDIEALVNFGLVPAGETVEKWVELHNLSPVSIIICYGGYNFSDEIVQG